MLLEFLFTALNLLIKSLGWVISLLFGLLPNSPFEFLMNGTIAQFLKGLNYFIPVSEIVVTLELWGSAILVYYLYSIPLRWIKGIE